MINAPGSMQTVATAARSLLDDGLVVVSVYLKWDSISCKTKVVPAVRGWQCFNVERARPSLTENANAVAIVTGAKSGVIVVDVDLPGLEQWHEVTQKYGLPTVPRVRTGSGGLHYYFSWHLSVQAGLKSTGNQVTLVLPDVGRVAVDVRAEGGCALCPPSKGFAKDGSESLYTWESPLATQNPCNFHTHIPC